MEECRDNLIGRTLGGTYELLRELGRGGMGTVYVARHVRLETSVAVKVLPSEQAGSDEAVLRFRREAMAASSLGHPGIVRVMDLNADGGVVYMVMEYLQGEDLAAHLARRGALPPVEALELFRRICEPITAAHRAGYIHRDLKPGNIFLARVEGCPDQVKILDFGLAKALYRADTAKLTRPGTAMGTPAYMPPEQIEGREPDIRVDVYALGAILFQLLAGRLPFDAPTLTALFAKVLTEPPPSLAAQVGAGDLPAPMDEVIRRALAKRPEDRFPDVPSLVSAVTLTGAPPAVAGTPPAVAACPVAAPLAPTMTAPGLAGTEPRAAPAAEPPSLEAASMVGSRPALRRRAGWWIAAAGLALAASAGMVALGPGRRNVVGQAARTTMPRSPATPAPRDAAAALAPATQPADMVVVPGGTLLVGSKPEETDRSRAWCDRLWKGTCPASWFARETPAHQVTIDGFLLDRHEVSNGKFAAWLTSLGSEVVVKRDKVQRGGKTLLLLDPRDSRISARNGRFDSHPGFADHPVVLVTWHGASEFCRGQGKRLPTEAEWERAARGADRRQFPWGEGFPDCARASFGRDNVCSKEPFCPAARACTAQGTGVEAVGSHPTGASAEGAEDLAGNVWEWVEDSFDPGCYARCRDGCRNPLCRSGRDRVVRGGSWTSTADALRAASRAFRPAGEAYADVGFRCARSGSFRGEAP